MKSPFPLDFTELTLNETEVIIVQSVKFLCEVKVFTHYKNEKLHINART